MKIVPWRLAVGDYGVRCSIYVKSVHLLGFRTWNMYIPVAVSLNAHASIVLYIYVIVVSWFRQCMGYVPCEGCMYFRDGVRGSIYIQHEGGTIPCTEKPWSCTDRPYKATARLASAPEYSTYCIYVCIQWNL